MNDKKAIAEKLLQIKAIKLSVNQPFTWASGWKSPIYCDNRKALSFLHVRDLIKSKLCNTISEIFLDTQMIAGVATAGIPWGVMVADELKLPFIYVRPKPKEHGLGNQIEGFYEKGLNTIVIEDLISTGNSSLDVVKVLKSSGLEVRGLVSIFNYGFKVAEEAFKKENLTSISLTDYETLVAFAIESKMISSNEEEILLNWSKNPLQWNA